MNPSFEELMGYPGLCLQWGVCWGNRHNIIAAVMKTQGDTEVEPAFRDWPWEWKRRRQCQRDCR